MKKKDIPWDELRRRYENGEGSYRALGAEFGISAARISQIAAREGWGSGKKKTKIEKDTAQSWLWSAAQQISEAARGTMDESRGEKLSVKELKELTGVLKELIALQQTMAPKETAQEKCVHIVLDDKLKKWSR